MKRIFLLLICIAVGAVKNNLTAQVSFAKDGVSYKLLGLDHQTLFSKDKPNKNYLDRLDYGAEIGYSRYLNKFLNLAVPVSIGRMKYPKADSSFVNGNFFAGGDLMGVFKFNNDAILKENAVLAPYLFAGVGGRYIGSAYVDKKYDVQIPLGLGLNIRFLPQSYIQLQSSFRPSLVQKKSSIEHSAGFLFLIGEGAPQEPKEIPVLDADGDGINDDADECPAVPGIAAFNGCPDTDGDGVKDADDACLEVAGLAEFAGCPDTDGDGLKDTDDNCPDTAGPKENNGCPFPDTDKDGILDKDDACPNQAGLSQFKGCPDTDGDGIADKDDKCPTVAGLPELNGCPKAKDPDADGDGIPDKDDLCPTKAGLAAFKGCPDTDGDGVSDNVDKCITEKGPVTNQGCPEIKQEDKQVITEAMGAVQFETGSAVLKKESYAVLDKVVVILNKYSNYSCSIEGHTDNVGADASNLALSEKRAKACYDYIVGKGISAARLSHRGFGETRPLYDNNTEVGRAKNRRTEFNLFIK